MGRHIEDALQPDFAVAQVGHVFDLRQQVDFMRMRRADHDTGLATLLAALEDVS